MLVLLVSLCASVAIEPVGKLKRLLQDVQETVRKSATDESVTIASAETFSQHLDLSLVKEIAALNRTLDTLQQAHHKQETDVASAELNLQHLHEAQDGSNTLATNYAAGSTNVGKKYSSVMMSLKALVALLKTSVVTPDGTLVTQAEPDEHGQATEVLRAIRTVLVSHKSAVSAPLLAAFNSTTPTLRPDLLEELVRTLEGIEREVDGRRVEALAQLDAKTRRYRSDAQLTASESEKRAGFLAESRRQVQDVVYAVEFTKAVVAKDEELRVKLAAFTATEDKVKRDLKILRGRQETALKDLLLLLDGQFKPNTKIVPTPPEALPADM